MRDMQLPPLVLDGSRGLQPASRHRLPVEVTAIALTVATTVVWIISLVVAADIGPAAYVSSLLVPVSICGVAIMLGALRGQPTAMAVLLAIAVLIPNLSFRTRVLGESGLDWQNGTKFAIWACLLIVASTHWSFIKGLLRAPGFAFAGAYAGVALLSALWSPVPAFSFGSAIGLFAWLGLAAVVALRIDDSTFTRVLLLALATEIVLGILGGFLLPDVAWMPPSIEEAEFRLQGFSGHPNIFAQHAALLILAVLFARSAKLLGPWSLAALFVIALGALIASGSRTTLGAVVVAWAVVALRDRGWLGRACLIVAIVLAVGLGAAGIGALPDIGELLGSFSRTGTTTEVTTLTGRTDLWAIAWEHFLQKPIFGWGFNGTELLMANSVGKSFFGNAVNAHNMVLQGLMSLGLIGALPAFAALATLVHKFFAQPNTKRDQITVFLFGVGVGEAEFFSTPVLLTFLVFWCLARDAVHDVHRPGRRIRAETWP